MKRDKFNFWDVLAWVVLFGIVVWLILKTLGIINTPLWIEYAPIYGAVYLAGWQIHKLETVASNVRELKKFKQDTISEINDMKNNCIKNHK